MRYSLGSEGGALSNQKRILVVNRAEKRNASTRLVLVEKAGQLEAGNVGFYPSSDIWRCCRCHYIDCMQMQSGKLELIRITGIGLEKV